MLVANIKKKKKPLKCQRKLRLSLMMPNIDPRSRFVYPHLTHMSDSYILETGLTLFHIFVTVGE